MQFSQVFTFVLSAFAVQAMVLGDQNQVDDTGVEQAVAETYPTINNIRTAGFPPQAYSDGIENKFDETLKGEVVTALTSVLGNVLDSFKDFGDVSGVDLSAMLAKSGYVVETTPEKKEQALKMKRGSSFWHGLNKVVGTVLTGISTVSGVLGKVEPVFNYIGIAADSLNGLLGKLT